MSVPVGLESRGPFLEGPEKFSHPESRSKILKLMITAALFYSQILHMNRGSLHTRSFRHIHTSVFRVRLCGKWLCGPEKFPGLSGNGPQVHLSFSETDHKQSFAPFEILQSNFHYNTDSVGILIN